MGYRKVNSAILCRTSIVNCRYGLWMAMGYKTSTRHGASENGRQWWVLIGGCRRMESQMVLQYSGRPFPSSKSVLAPHLYSYPSMKWHFHLFRVQLQGRISKSMVRRWQFKLDHLGKVASHIFSDVLVVGCWLVVQFPPKNGELLPMSWILVSFPLKKMFGALCVYEKKQQF